MIEFVVVRILIIIGALVAVAETIAAITWLPVYFRYGIPLYVSKVAGNLSRTRHELTDLVSCSQSGFSFHRLAAHEIAFREPLITFTRIPVMHGLLLYDGRSVKITGLINWSILAFGILWFAVGGIFLLEAPIYAMLMLAAFIGSLAWAHDLQRERLNDLVVELAAQLEPIT